MKMDDLPLLRLAACLMVGIVAGDMITTNLPLLPMLVAGVVVALLLWKWALWQSLAIAGCFVVLGALLVQHQLSSVRVAWPPGEVCYEAVVTSDPVEKPKTMAVDVLLTGSGQKLKCYVYKDARSRALRIGDGLRIQSYIKENSDWHIGSFDYRRYLEVNGFAGSTFVSSWKWRKAEVSLAPLSRLERTRLFFLVQRDKLLRRLSAHGLYGDAYAVVAAMALGDKSALTKDLKEVYSKTGASHVLALSGLHLGIIYTLLSLLVVGRRWRMTSQVVMVLAVWAFVFLVGMPTSVVRAAVMLSIYALLSLAHRDRMSVNTLAFTAIGMLIANPLSLFDVGFQMSFMAVFSILLFQPLFEGVFPQGFLMDHGVVKWIWGLAVVSCAAQIGTAPLVAYYFGRFSTCFLLTNFIVVPAATLILYLMPVVLIMPSRAYLLLYVVGGLNSILDKIAAMPWTSIEGLHPSILQVVMTYVIAGAVYLLALRLRRIARPRLGLKA